MSRDEKFYGVPDWRDHPKTLPLHVPPRRPEMDAYFGRLWPACDPYVSRLNPAFLADLQALDTGRPNERWLIRDGLLSLIWFFIKNPAPNSFKGSLLIDSEFEAFVPDAWRPQASLYDFFPDGYEAASKPTEVKDLVLLGLIMPSVCSLSRLESDLSRMTQIVGGQKKWKDVRIRAVLPARYEISDAFAGHAFYNRFMSTLVQYLGPNVEYLEPHTYQWHHFNSSTWFHEFNEKYLYADSFFTEIALSKGHWAMDVQTKVLDRSRLDEIVPAFPHVSCGIRKKFEKPFINYVNSGWMQTSQEVAKALHRVMDSSAIRSFDWPDWFFTWCKDISTGEQGRKA